MENYLEDLKQKLYEEKKYLELLYRKIEEDNRKDLEEDIEPQKEYIKQIEEEIEILENKEV